MELFEEIRREYEHGEKTIKGVARKLGIHRRMVREAMGSAVPRARKKDKDEELTHTMEDTGKDKT